MVNEKPHHADGRPFRQRVLINRVSVSATLILAILTQPCPCNKAGTDHKLLRGSPRPVLDMNFSPITFTRTPINVGSQPNHQFDATPFHQGKIRVPLVQTRYLESGCLVHMGGWKTRISKNLSPTRVR